MARPRSQFPKELFYFKRLFPGSANPNAISAGNPNYLSFEAHITSWSDSSSPNWTDNYDMGRADAKVQYQSVTREVRLSIFLVAMNKEEHRNNHDFLLANLGKMTYPIYVSGNGFAGSHVYFKIGNVIESYGIITSLQYDWKPEYPIVDFRPIYTDISLSIRVLANGDGKRPDSKQKYFI
jgi:hypothetical protein